MNLKYLLGSIVAVPLLPVLYFQGKRIRASVPRLPEATDPQGVVEKTGQTVLNLLCIGESTMAGVGVEIHKEGFVGTLAEELSELLQREVQWQVYARSGYTAKRMTEKLVPKAKNVSADLIVVGVGGNDAFTLNRPKKFRLEVEALIKAIHFQLPDVPIFFTNMPPIKEFPAFTSTIKFVVGNLVEILGETLADVVAQYENVFYSAETITMRGWMKKWDVAGKAHDFFSDGVHPSKLTYQVWAKDMAHFINSTSVIPSRISQKA
ncbi:MAG: SGNH/GDSL hydrolase family protein [Bacteroidota bacterium]